MRFKSEKRQDSWRKLFVLVLLIVLGFLLRGNESQGAEPDPERQKQIDLYMDLGILKYGKLDASGSREILILSRDGTGAFTHQHLTEADGQDFAEILTKRGLLRGMPNRETGRREKHVMVFNPKDKHTFVWVPVSKLPETQERIKTTGKTIPPDASPRRVTEDTLSTLQFPDSF